MKIQYLRKNISGAYRTRARYCYGEQIAVKRGVSFQPTKPIDAAQQSIRDVKLTSPVTHVNSATDIFFLVSHDPRRGTYTGALRGVR